MGQVRLGQQAMARGGDEGGVWPARGEFQQHVDRGEPQADHRHGTRWRHRVELRQPGPRVDDVATAVQRGRAHALQRLRRQCTQRQHGGIGAMAAFAVDHGDAVAFGHQRIDLERHHVDVMMAARHALLQCAGHLGLQVVAVAPARQEIGAADRRVVALHEIQEALRLAGEHAHRRGAHVQQVALRASAVGHAAHRFAGTGEPVQLQRLRRLALQQLTEQAGGRGAAADDGDPSKHAVFLFPWRGVGQAGQCPATAQSVARAVHGPAGAVCSYA